MGDSETAAGAGRLALGVVTFNNDAAQLAQLLRSVELAAREVGARSAVELYVIDNGAESVWPASGVALRRLQPVGNVGFGHAMNLLMAAAFADDSTGRFLCVNPDGVMHPRCLDELLRASELSPGALIEARQFPEEHMKSYDEATLETPWASGACLLIPRALYEAVGGFDVNFFMYLEDIDLSWRARSAGFKVLVAPGALFGHPVLGRAPSPAVERFTLTSGRYLAFKWKGERFREWVEGLLIERGLFASRAELPALPEPGAGRFDPSVADFEHGFDFAPVRW
ncbi:MAG TPA: glycosyltransferase family 2 protein [Pyrinomonadaceae bacterium]|jgi:GT2 family glycosyltransferase